MSDAQLMQLRMMGKARAAAMGAKLRITGGAQTVAAETPLRAIIVRIRFHELLIPRLWECLCLRTYHEQLWFGKPVIIPQERTRSVVFMFALIGCVFIAALNGLD